VSFSFALANHLATFCQRSLPVEVQGTHNTGNVPLQYLVVEGPLRLDMSRA